MGQTVKVRVTFTDDADNQESLTSAATAVVVAKPNTPATGLPTIGGTAQAGQTLTADTSGIADQDGLDDAEFSYQWLRNDGNDDAEIAGANSETYTLAPDDEGKTIKVRVSFTDDAGTPETLTSAATGNVAAKPNTPATGQPTISGTAQAGETLTADTSGVTDEDGLANVDFNYQWLADDADIQGATDSTYGVSDNDVGKAIKVRVSFTDNANNQESLTSTATDAVTARPNSPATGAPTISGTARVGEPLTADTSDISDADGLTNVSYSYQWIRNDGSSDADIGGQTGSTYTLTDEDVGKSIKVRVSFTDDADNQETLTSGATESVAAAAYNPATGVPTISGTAQVGETLTAETQSISDEDRLTNVSYTYQWIRHDSETDTDIEDATDSTYTLSDADLGKTIKVRVSFSDDANNQETLTSAATAAVAAKPNSPATGLPTISGTAQVDETLTADVSSIADADGLTNVSYSYQWLADEANIQSATNSTYTLTNSDEGKAIKVKVSFTDDANNEESLTSAATEAVAPRSDNTLTDKEAPVWSADMLVVEYTEVSIGAASADLFSNIGGSRDLKIKSLWSHVPSRDIRLAFQEGVSDADDLTLIVGDLTLEFPAGGSGEGSFKWTDVDVDWEDGETIPVRIVRTSSLAKPPANKLATGAPTITGTPPD